MDGLPWLRADRGFLCSIDKTVAAAVAWLGPRRLPWFPGHSVRPASVPLLFIASVRPVPGGENAPGGMSLEWHPGVARPTDS